LVIPGHAEARPNEWSRQQIASLLGVHFDRWFEAASADERAEEMSRRLRRSKGNVRLRLAEIQGTVVLRALLSPGYTPIRDSSILEILGSALDGTVARIRRLDLTDRMTTATISIGEPQYVGGVVGSVWGSITLINSGVGWSGLSVSVSLLRLACSNGMRAPLMNARLIDLRHRHVHMNAIQNVLVGELRNLPGNLSSANRVLADSTAWGIQNVEAEARAILREAGMVRKHLNGVFVAYKSEPIPSVFGLSQAMTRHAQVVSPEERVALEALAGNYVLRAAP
jgi:plasmid stability protein